MTDAPRSLVERNRELHAQYVERADMGTIFQENATALEALEREVAELKNRLANSGALIERLRMENNAATQDTLEP